jgi:hypothetical protein
VRGVTPVRTLAQRPVSAMVFDVAGKYLPFPPWTATT